MKPKNELTSPFARALTLLKAVIKNQIELIVNWMRVGFIHGVMNTDNMTISGETIDYGPCAFMDQYDPKTVFSSIDQFGRYSFENQPRITKWNLARFAECIVNLINSDEDKAIKIATETINNFEKIYENKWLNMMRNKLGLFGEDKNDKKLINDLLIWMETNQADYTNTFCKLMGMKVPNDELYKNLDFIGWSNKWQKRLLINNNSKDKYLKLMKTYNPIVIPRNYKVEEALNAANKGNLEVFNKLLSILTEPYNNHKNVEEYQFYSTDKEYQTFCGT